ncbi:hypothetical protein BHM03_00045371 [Ensete ventricosum]|nr:hypothetical protein BHM03_00045371 [Ensete ventricosum]
MATWTSLVPPNNSDISFFAVELSVDPFIVQSLAWFSWMYRKDDANLVGTASTDVSHFRSCCAPVRDRDTDNGMGIEEKNGVWVPTPRVKKNVDVGVLPSLGGRLSAPAWNSPSPTFMTRCRTGKEEIS